MRPKVLIEFSGEREGGRERVCVSVCVCECVRVFNFKHHSIYLVVVRIELGTFGCEAKSFNPLAIFLVVRV